LYKTVSYTITSLTVTDVAQDYSQFYVTAISYNIASAPSNVITVN